MINETVKRVGIITGLILCVILSFVIRLSPMAYIAGSGDMLGAPDSWYNLRLVEYMLNNGQMLNFDPMTAYDDGNIVNWGVVFTVLSSFLAVIAGAVTRTEILDAVSWLSPIMASLCVIVMFFIGKKFGDWKTGLITALFTAIVSGQYFSRSLYGLFDHHVAEVLFGCLFCLCYLISLQCSKNANFKNLKSLKIPILLGVLTGLSYFLGLLTMTTLIIFGLFAMIFTIIQFIINYHKEVSSDYLVILNSIVFLIGLIGLLVYGVKVEGLDLVSYSHGLLIIQILPIIVVWILYGLTKVNRFKHMKYHHSVIYIGMLIGISVVACIICAIVNYDLFEMILYNIQHQFTPSVGGMTTVQEASAWSFEDAWSSFNAGLILAILGFGFICYKVIKEQNVLCHFLLWWTVGVFILACAQIRWEYYLAPNIALLAGIFVGWVLSLFASKIKSLKSYNEEKINNKKKKKSSQKPNVLPITCLTICVLLLAGSFFGVSLFNDIYLSNAYGQGGTTSPNWVDACEWLKLNTPETGVEYYGEYEKETFKYPNESYGIVSWWDFGHYITVIGERLPVANPFQMGIDAVAEILMETDEERVCQLMEEYGCKYIMVDYNTGNNFIPVMAVWLDRSISSQRDMYDTLAFRLYNLEGKGSESYNIPALKHFKLIYTSPKKTYGYDINGKIVEQTTKIFEYS